MIEVLIKYILKHMPFKEGGEPHKRGKDVLSLELLIVAKNGFDIKPLVDALKNDDITAAREQLETIAESIKNEDAPEEDRNQVLKRIESVKRFLNEQPEDLDLDRLYDMMKQNGVLI